nr:hypothetical protein [Tanacetum cinerariifolium]
KELFKIKRSVATIFDGVERCKQTIAKKTYFGHIDPFIQNTIEANFYPEIRRINAGLEKFHVCLKEEMVADLRYFNSLELETLPPNKKSILKNTNVLAPGMYKLHTDHNQTRTSQLPQDSRKTNKRVSFSTGVIPTTSVSSSQLKSNPMGDRVMRNNSQGKKQEVEDQRRNVKFPKNKTFVIACNDSLNAKTLNVNSVSAMCDKCISLCQILHCLLILLQLIEIVLFIVDFRCSKHMTGNLKLLINFVEKFLGMVKFGNDQITPILGYGDLVQGAVRIKRVYYVEGLNHNLFFVGQFCDADLEVTFRMSTCYIRDLKGNDLLQAISSQAWLWHRHLSHLNFDTINLLSKNDIVTMALEHESLSPASQHQVNVPQADRTVTTSNELDLLFSLMFDELLNGSSKVVSKSSAVYSVDAPNQRQHHTTPLNNHTTPAPTCHVPSLAPTVSSSENISQAETPRGDVVTSC